MHYHVAYETQGSVSKKIQQLILKMRLFVANAFEFELKKMILLFFGIRFFVAIPKFNGAIELNNSQTQ